MRKSVFYPHDTFCRLEKSCTDFKHCVGVLYFAFTQCTDSILTVQSQQTISESERTSDGPNERKKIQKKRDKTL